jgi:hypothetical protein
MRTFTPCNEEGVIDGGAMCERRRGNGFQIFLNEEEDLPEG